VICRATHSAVVVDFTWQAFVRFFLVRRRRNALQTLQTEISSRTPTMGQQLKPKLMAVSGAGQTAILGRSATLTRPS
jgi:hypothetical protein